MVVPPGGGRGGRPPMRGGAGRRVRVDTPATQPEAHSAPPLAARKKRILFVCIGNSCRSQMAEAFARSYGGHIPQVPTPRLAPPPTLDPLTPHPLAPPNPPLH